MHNPSKHKVYEFDNFRLDAESLMLYHKGNEVALVPKAVETLLVLIENQGQITAKNELIKAVWDVVVEESNLSLYLHLLRKTLGNRDNSKPYVETFRRRGYRFNGQARIVVDNGEESYAWVVDNPGEGGTNVDTRSGRLYILKERKDNGTDPNDADTLPERSQPSASARSIKSKEKKVRYVFAITLSAILVAGVFAAAFYWSSRQTPAADIGTKDVEAWEYYRQGSFHLGRVTPPEIRKSIEYFHKAIDRDPNYTLAYTGLARAYISLPPSSDYAPSECFPKAKAAAQKALQIDEQLAEGHSVMASVLFWYDWDWKSSEDQCHRAIDLDSNSADAHYAYAHLLSNVGRHAEALTEMKRAREIDPTNLRIECA